MRFRSHEADEEAEYKNDTLPTEVVDGSNESLYYPDEGLGPYLKTGSLL